MVSAIFFLVSSLLGFDFFPLFVSIMTLTKRQVLKAAKYSLAVGLVVPAVSAIIYMVSLAPAPIAFGAILGLLTFPGFIYYFR